MARPRSETVSLRTLLASLTGRFAAAGVDSPALSARLLAGHALGLDRVGLATARDRDLTPAQVAAVEALAARREAGEPAAYLLGRKEFYGREFLVDARVLVPRPETEHLVEAALARFDRSAPIRFADLGTGSGALAVTLALEFPNSRGLAVDRSAGALAVARANAAALGAADRLLFLRADFARPLASDAALDLVATNPPYVTEAEYAGLSREVRDFEPPGALVGGPDGLDPLRRIAAAWSPALRAGGWLLAEHGAEQGRGARDVLTPWLPGPPAPATIVDLAGLDRLVAARRVLQKCHN
ncbi:MAG: peptide chain release factor N(5)-glutamine methyltransferase [Desulfovibrionaceae bacterium]